MTKAEGRDRQRTKTWGQRFDRPVRTDMDCHECGKNFIAMLDYSLDGNHVVECPHCGHEHCRVIESGRVTGDRWSSRHDRVAVEKRCVWKCDSRPMVTSAAAMFIRQRWLDRESS